MGNAAAMVTYRLIVDGGTIVLWLAAGWGIGRIILWKLAFARDRVVTAIAVGLGFIGLLTLGLGLTGILNPIVAWGIVVVGIVALIATRPRVKISRPPAVWLLAVPSFALAIFAALVPAGILWGDEPNGYDVVEYHLQVPREWFEMHRIAPLRHNVFSYFPQNVEMHYLLAMELRGDPWSAQFTAQLMHVAFCALACAAVWEMTRSHVAGAIMASTPWIALLAPVAYNEGGMLLYGALAIGWTIEALREKSIAHFALAGAFVGLACGVKLTAVVLLLGIPIALLLSQPRTQVRGILIFIGCGLLTFAPWLIRNAVWARNPVFPEAQKILGHAHFTDVQTERWKRAHSPTEAQRSITARLRAFWDQIVAEWRFGFVLIPVGVTAILLSRKRESRFLVIVLGILTIFWIFFTHLQGRFFVMAIPIIAMIVAQSNEKIWQLAPAILMCVTIATVGNRFMKEQRRGVFAALGYERQLPLAVLEQVQPDAKLYLVGDAKAYWYQRPIGYRTVFDVDASGKNIIDAWLGGEPREGKIIIVDPNELARFAKTYYGVPPLGDDVPGPRDQPFILQH